MKKIKNPLLGYGRPTAPGLTFAALKLACAEYHFEELR